ncbi:MAG: hypothetical protein LUO89_10025 [Methanothrix sp.]|nr:hypothetical protein [Methanothrix sp.]
MKCYHPTQGKQSLNQECLNIRKTIPPVDKALNGPSWDGLPQQITGYDKYETHDPYVDKPNVSAYIAAHRKASMLATKAMETFRQILLPLILKFSFSAFLPFLLTILQLPERGGR